MKTFLTKWLPWILLFIALIVIFSMQTCNKKLNDTIKVMQDKSYKDSTDFVLYKNAIGQQIAQQNQKIASQEAALAAGLITQKELSDKHIKELQLVAKAYEKLLFVNQTVQYKDTGTHTVVYVTDSTGKDSSAYVKVGTTFEKRDSFILIKGAVAADGARFDTLLFYSEPKFTFGKAGFFKAYKPVAIYENASPYAHTVGMNNLVITVPVPWYKKPWVNFLFGTGFGILLDNGIRIGVSKIK